MDQLLLLPPIAQWVERTSRGFVVSEIQSVLQELREKILSGTETTSNEIAYTSLETLLEDRLQSRLRPGLVPVINATGVIIHTNLGRAPMSVQAMNSLSAVAAQYTNLEFDLAGGERSYRDSLVERSLREILGCEAATVANNNAAAIFLIINTLGLDKEVIVSRGELVEIGGSFRLPDIMARSGGILREVGTTNKTHIEDYADAIGPNTAMLLRVHPSNYRIQGFTHRPELPQLLDLAHQAGVPLVEDIGSGCLVDLAPYGITDEPSPQKSLASGTDLVCFSGDKLMGGPQSGIIAGARRFVNRIRKNPLMRTYRVEKLIYGALETTLLSYRTGNAFEDIPVLRLVATPESEVQKRARRFLRRISKRLPTDIGLRLTEGKSLIGGGSCPQSELPTTLLVIESDAVRPAVIDACLREQNPPVIARVEDDRVLLDLRTVFKSQEDLLEEKVLQGLQSSKEKSS